MASSKKKKSNNELSASVFELPTYDAKTWKISVIKNASPSMLKRLTGKQVPKEKLESLKTNLFRRPDIVKKDILDLSEQYPMDPDLRILFAICIYEGSKKNKAKDKALSLKKAIEYIASGIVSGRFSIYHTESLLVIYFEYLKAFHKVFTPFAIRPRTSEDDLKIDIKETSRILKLLDSPKSHAIKTMRLLQKKLGKDFYFKILEDKILDKSFKYYLDKNKFIENLDYAKTIVFAIYSIMQVLVQIPVLKHFSKRLIERIPTDNEPLSLMKGSLISNQSFFRVKLESEKKDYASLKKELKSIFDTNLKLLDRLNYPSAKQNFEGDAYLNLANAAELYSFYTLRPEFEPVIKKAMDVMEILMEKDDTRDQRYIPVARGRIVKLKAVLSTSKSALE